MPAWLWALTGVLAALLAGGIGGAFFRALRQPARGSLTLRTLRGIRRITIGRAPAGTSRPPDTEYPTGELPAVGAGLPEHAGYGGPASPAGGAPPGPERAAYLDEDDGPWTATERSAYPDEDDRPWAAAERSAYPDEDDGPWTAAERSAYPDEDDGPWLDYERRQQPDPDPGSWPGLSQQAVTSRLTARPAGSRYANVTLADLPRQQPWPAGRPLGRSQALLLRIGIGPLAAASQVRAPAPFPDEHLPGGDLTIDVVVTSETFWLAPGLRAAAGSWGRSQQASFVLPADGSPARAGDGTDELLFELIAPSEPGTARLRIGYYYHGAVVQSQVLVADIGAAAGAGGSWSLTTDYTIAEDLPSAAAIPARPRVAVVLHEDAAGQAIFARGAEVASGVPVHGDPSGAGPGTAISVPPALAGRVRELRKLLASEPVAPTAVRQSKAQLTRALRALAPVGWELYAGLFPSLRDTFYQLGAGNDGPGAGPAVLHVARPAGVGLSVPWAYLYTIGLDSAYAARGFAEVPLCPLVADWDGHSELVTDDLSSCPQAGAVSHASNLLCPFGFLGMRHDIEQLSSAQRPVLSIEARPGSRVVIAETAYQVAAAALGTHVTALRQTLAARLPGVTCLEAVSKARLAELIRADLPLVYFYCHGERPNAASPETYLGIGKREWVTAPDFMSWVQEAYLVSGLRVWDKVRPLVFINACHSAELDPRALFNYVDAFVGVGNAAGVIGTEVRVHQDLAMGFAQAFFTELLAGGGTVAVALRRARLRFLARGNLFGLTYTPYCWADLTLTGPAPEPSDPGPPASR